MKIYTKTGDKGSTQVFLDAPLRVKKNDAILECYGTLDELNAHIGVLKCSLPPSTPNPSASDGPDSTSSDSKNVSDHAEHIEFLEQIQQRLFDIGFVLSASNQLDDRSVEALEAQIDRLDAALPALTQFILPGGGQCAAYAHVCRTVTRRAERQLVGLTEQHSVPDLCLSYLNRLSDYFFVLARTLTEKSEP